MVGSTVSLVLTLRHICHWYIDHQHFRFRTKLIFEVGLRAVADASVEYVEYSKKMFFIAFQTCAIGMGKDVGQPVESSVPARQPLNTPWHASENSTPGTLSRGKLAVMRWLTCGSTEHKIRL